MATVYILYSTKADHFYIGSCEDLAERLKQHNNKEYGGSYTALQADDWVLFWSVYNLQYEQARKIELHIKSMKSRKYLRNLKEFPEIIERLKLKYA